MALYLFYFVAPVDGLPQPLKEFECRNDEAAIEKAFELLDAQAIEVWRGSRFVARLEPREFLYPLH